MARKPKPAKCQIAKSQPANSREIPLSGKTGWPLWTALLLPVAAVLLPSCLVLGAALALTAVAYMIDPSRAKNLAITVGLTNLCGALPIVVELWSKGQSYAVTLEIAGDAFSWFLAYGAAAVGWSLFLFLPQILASYYAMTTDTRLALLHRRQASLTKVWGKEVTGQTESESPNPVNP